MCMYTVLVEVYIIACETAISFSSVLTPKEAEQMRAYVVSRAHYAKTNDAALGGGSKKAVK